MIQPASTRQTPEIETPAPTPLIEGDKKRPALVVLHGWGSSSQAWCETVELLAQQFYVVALDYPGTGSAQCLDSYTVPDHAAWVLQFLSDLGIERFSLVGHSMGGNIAAQIAISAPERVDALALLSPALYSDRLHGAKVYLMPVSGSVVLRFARLGSGLLASVGTFGYKLTNRARLRVWARTQQLFASASPQDAVTAQLAALIRNPLRLDSLNQSIPVLLIHGTKDRVIPLRHSKDMHRSRPHNTALLIYADADHNPLDSDPHRLARDIAQFLIQSAVQLAHDHPKVDAYAPAVTAKS
jgi:pimeloyl-ACP methyl ester carboxylesterase